MTLSVCSLHMTSYQTILPLQTTSALDVLTRNCRLLSRPALPAPVADPRNQKQKLWNDFIAFLSDKSLKWRADEMGSSGKAFMKAMVDTLWLIDVQHDVFRSRDHLIPSTFHSFSGYNQPQLSKHRKRDRENMSCTSLRVCADALFGCLQCLLGAIWLEGVQV